MQFCFTTNAVRVALALLLAGYSSMAYGQASSDSSSKNSYYLGVSLPQSAETVTSESFNKGFITQPAGLMQGLFTGLNIYPTGEPGKPFEVYSRLFTEFSQSAVRFYVVDNLPVYGDISFLNPSDIASISYLDGGASAAIYGNKAVNGAILIKTKATTRSLTVSYCGTGAVSYVPKLVDVYNADEYREYVKKYDPRYLSLLGSENTNWQEAIYRTAFSHQHSVVVSDNVYGIPVRVSTSFMDSKGAVIATDSKRFTGAIAVTPTFLNNSLSVDARLWFARHDGSPMHQYNKILPNNDVISLAILSMDPTQPVYSNDGYGGYFYYKDVKGNPIVPSNPLAILEQEERSRNQNQLNQSYTVSYCLPFLRDLTLSAGYAAASTFIGETAQDGGKTAWNYFYGQRRTEYSSNNLYDTWNVLARYQHQLKFFATSLSLAAGYSETSFDNSEKYSAWTNYQLSSRYNNDDDDDEKARFALVNVEMLNRYSAGVSVRSEKSSFYWRDFDVTSYSLSAGWNVKEEPFLKNVNAVASLSVFGSYSVSEGTPSINESDITISDDIKPSKMKTWNVGVAAGLLDGKATLRATYARNDANGLFFLFPQSPSIYSLRLVNLGRIASSNFEVKADVRLLKRHDLTWKAQAAVSFATSEVKTLREISDLYVVGYKSIEVGHPINSFYRKQQVYQINGRPIEGGYNDFNGNGNTSDDFYSVGQTTPSTLLSISSQLTYKRWELSFLGRAAFGASAYNSMEVESYYGKRYFCVSNIVKSAEKAGFESWQGGSDYYVQNASFFRMEYISLGYTFGGKLRPNLAATVQNAFLITKYNGFDPETSTGIDEPRYPLPRIFSVSLSLNL